MMSNSKIKPFDWLEEVQRKVYEVRKLESSAEGQMLMVSAEVNEKLKLVVNPPRRQRGLMKAMFTFQEKPA